ncbi:MAG: DNA polymerase Y family protein [Candidatus Saccharimonadales bacterium]
MDWLINRAAPEIMHIDLNSCFSTIEQQANPLIRHKPVAVAAYDKPAGIVLAASYDAKALGIKLGTHVYEARQLCPELIVLMPDPPKYREAHRRFHKILLKYTSDVTPKSIDEFVVDFVGSPALRAGQNLEQIGYEIKQDIKKSLGEYVTVNVGIGPNRFLAKLAAGLNKPNGLDVITHENILDVYKTLILTDLPGINRHFSARLRAAGISSPLEFLAADANFLKNFVFYSKTAYDWHQRLRGWEVDNREFGRKSIGHQYALENKTAECAELTRLLMKLSEKVGRRLRGKDLTASGTHLALRYVSAGYWHQSQKTAHPLYSTQEIFAAAKCLLDNTVLHGKVSLMSLTVYDLRPINPEQLGLFEELSERQKRLATAADSVNDRYGEFTVFPAIMGDMGDTILDRVAFGQADIK